MIRVVVDTSVVVSALRSRRGASFRLMKLVGRERFGTVVSVPLVLEYESAAKRISRSLGLRHSEIDDVLDYLCKVSEHRQIFYLWRPHLRDPSDDMVLELAVEAEADAIVTHNVRDFSGAEQFGIRVLTPQELLREIGELE
jgi:putative PIN family toxin of toxin-antitoxin system